MTPQELIAARKQLDLTKTQMAHVLGYSAYKPYARLEDGIRGIDPRVSKLVKALLILSKTEHAKEFGLE
jgi:predicted transcriptional regulator